MSRGTQLHSSLLQVSPTTTTTNPSVYMYFPPCRCDRAGHFARDCSEQEDERDAVMGREKVVADPRAREYGLGGGLKCYKCSRYGHFAKDCKDEDDRCYRCFSGGHIAR